MEQPSEKEREKEPILTNTKESFTGLKLPPPLKRKLRRLAVAEDRSLSAMIRILILEALAARNK